MNILDKYTFISGLFIWALFVISSNSIAGSIFSDEDILWESGINLYIKLTDQESSARGKSPNDHPIDLDEKNISVALESLKIWEKEYLSSGLEPEPVFSIRQSNLLGRHLSNGLKKAGPDQDIVFALQSNKTVGAFGLRENAFVAGRAFYKNGKLNIIIGDYDRPRDKGLEVMYGQTGTEKVRYNFDNGHRRKSSDFDKAIIKVAGVDNMKVEGRIRRDWITIDVNEAAEAYLAEQKAKQNPVTPRDRALEVEAAKMAKERREMRLEMARLRKEMEENNASGGGASSESVEDRLKVLDELKEKGLVSEDEYSSKRQEILKDI